MPTILLSVYEFKISDNLTTKLDNLLSSPNVVNFDWKLNFGFNRTSGMDFKLAPKICTKK